MQAARLIRRAVPLILMGAGLAAARRHMERRRLGQLPESPLGGPPGGVTAHVPAGVPSGAPVGAPAKAEASAGREAALTWPATIEAEAPAVVEAGMAVPTVVDADPAGPTVVDVEVLPDAPDPEAAPEPDAEPEPDVDPGFEPEPESDAEPIPEQAPTSDAEAPTAEVPAIEEPPASVTDIVDDLIGPHPAEGGRIEDATVVEDDEPGNASEGARERG